MDMFRTAFRKQQHHDEAMSAKNNTEKNATATSQQRNNTAPLPDSQPTPQNTEFRKQQQQPSQQQQQPTTTNNNNNTSTHHNIPKINLAPTQNATTTTKSTTSSNEPIFGQTYTMYEEASIASISPGRRGDHNNHDTTMNPSRLQSELDAFNNNKKNNNSGNNNDLNNNNEKQVTFRDPGSPAATAPINSIHASSSSKNASSLEHNKTDEPGFFRKLFSRNSETPTAHDDHDNKGPNIQQKQGSNNNNNSSTQQKEQQPQLASFPKASTFTNPPDTARSEAHSLFDQAPAFATSFAASYNNSSQNNNNQQRGGGIMLLDYSNNNNQSNNNNKKGHQRSVSTQNLAIPSAIQVKQKSEDNKNNNNNSKNQSNNNNNNNNNLSYSDSIIPIVAQPFIPATNAALRAQRATVSVGFTGACTGALCWVDNHAYVMTSIDSVFDNSNNEYLKLMQLAIRSPCIPKHFIPDSLFVCDTPEEHQGGVAMLKFSDVYSQLLRPLCVELSEKVCALHSQLLGFQIEVPTSRRIFDEDHIFGGSALSAISVTVVQTRSEYVWRAMPDLSKSVSAVTGAPLFDEVGNIVCIVVGSGSMITASSYNQRWDFERKTLANDSEREFLKRDYQMSRLGPHSFIAPNSSGISSASSAKAMQNVNIVGKNVEWEGSTIATLECARALDEMFRASLPGGALAVQGAIGGFGSSTSDTKNRYIEVPKPSSSSASKADMFHANNGNNNNGMSANHASASPSSPSLTRHGGQHRLSLSHRQASFSPETKKRIKEQEMVNPVDELVAQDNLFRLINQPSSAAMGLASSLPRLIRTATLPTSWALVHAKMASSKKIEVQAGSVRVLYS